MQGRPINTASFASESPERLAGLQLATARAPLWLRQATLPPDLQKLGAWQRPCLVHFGPGREGLSSWSVLKNVTAGQVTLLDSQHGAVILPVEALQPALKSAVGLYFDADGIAESEPGEAGPRVARLRRALIENGRLELVADAVEEFDATLVAALEAFQRQSGLEPTGQADDQTAWLLMTSRVE